MIEPANSLVNLTDCDYLLTDLTAEKEASLSGGVSSSGNLFSFSSGGGSTASASVRFSASGSYTSFTGSVFTSVSRPSWRWW